MSNSTSSTEGVKHTGPCFRVVRLDMWDYRHPTGHVFDSPEAASQKADELQRLSDQTIADPTSCYFWVREDADNETGSAA